MVQPTHLMDTTRFTIRPATQEDVPGMTDVFFRSFNAPFWQYFTPDKPAIRQFWHDAWSMGIDNPTDKSFVVVDTQNQDKVVAFSRWMVPQSDGDQTRKWPEMKPEDWDFGIVGPFFGGMGASRAELMGQRPHWFLEMLGVDESLHGQGIGASLIRWGTDQADADNLETYLDASAKGYPYYIKHHGFRYGKDIPVPERPEYGTYDYRSVIRAPKKIAE